MEPSTRRMLAVPLVALLGLGLIRVARTVPFLGLARPERVVLVLTLLLPAVLAVSTVGPGFDAEAYRAERGVGAFALDMAVVTVAGVAIGLGLVTVLSSLSDPIDVAVAVTGAYGIGFAYFQTRNGSYFRLADKSWGTREAGNEEE